MVSGLTAATERFLASLQSIGSRIDKAQKQVGSGYKLQSPSDAPSQVNLLVGAEEQYSLTVQNGTNLGRVKVEVDTAEKAISDAVSLLEKVNTLGSQGATGTQTPAQRTVIAGQVAAYMDQIVADASTTTEGRYIFSGDDYDQAPYFVDLTQPNGVTTYGGGLATRQMTDPSGTRFNFTRSADEIFDNPTPGSSVFGALNQLRIALETGPTVPEGDPNYNSQYEAQTTAIKTGLEALHTAQDHLNGQLSFYGSVQTRVNGAVEFGKKLELRQKTDLSGIQDADIAEAASELAQGLMQQQATLSARARLTNKSLFDYMG